MKFVTLTNPTLTLTLTPTPTLGGIAFGCMKGVAD